MKTSVLRILFLTALIVLAAMVQGSAQNLSNKGKDFYLPYAAHIDGLLSRMTLILSADYETTYIVQIGTKTIATGSISANTSRQVVIDPNVESVYIGTSEVVEKNKAIRVTTNKAISLYAIQSYSARTGGSLITPVNTLGSEYYAFSYQTGTNAGTTASQFIILATQDGTTVEITPKSASIGGSAAGVKKTISLNKGEIYQYQSRIDVTGSFIKTVGACKPIAVFSGNTWASFCEGGNTRTPSGGDNIYQQLFPVSAWGKNFITAPFYNTLHGNTDIFKIIVAEDNTTVTVNGSTVTANEFPLNNPYAKGSVITFTSTSPNQVSADKPIALGHYQTSQTCNINNINNQTPFPGDPELTLLNPIEQTLNDITVYSTLGALGVPTQIGKYYINVIIKTADIPSFKMDGLNYASAFVPIQNSLYSYAIIDVTNLPGQHRLIADGGFSAIAYGYGNVESYAYLAGANVKNFTFEPLSAATRKPITSGCTTEPIILRINLPYQPLKLVWDVQDVNGVVTENNPAFKESRMVDGITYYTYEFPNAITYTTPKDYAFTVNATKPTADVCGSTEELNVEFSVFPKPIAGFTFSGTSCATTEISFQDKSDTNGDLRALNNWLWDFGDGQTSTEQNPKHAFAAPGTYTVSLTSGITGSCFSTFKQDIVIYPLPVAKFTTNPVTCINTALMLTDQSTIGAGYTITRWNWNFGDGTNETRTDKQPFTHIYAAAGTYTISLVAESDKGCSSVAITKDVLVTVLPTADFDTPELCLTDATASFPNLSANIDGTKNGLTYAWNFGDVAGSNAANPNTSTQEVGRHKFYATGDFIITLTVTNENGCSVVATKTITVNGASPVANFEVQNPSSLCSNTTVEFKNTSTVDAGNITRLEWYFDVVNAPAAVVTIEDPLPNAIYTTTYLPFSSPLTKTVTVRLVAYSGISCTSTKEQVITLKASPSVVFADIPFVCLQNGPVKLTQATETGGSAGTGVYSGKGILPDGTFDPLVAGPGNHPVTYTFTNANGCVDTKTKSVTVFENPVVDAGEDVFILQGGEATLHATASGKNLTYKWTPSTGLDRDDVLTPVAKPAKDIDYVLTVTSEDGCITTDKVHVTVLEDIVPFNSFTPNGDGVNDVWNISYINSYPNATVEIYNRNGNRVYFSKGYSVPFDGRYKNSPLPVGAYYYIINPGNGRKSITGNLTLLR